MTFFEDSDNINVYIGTVIHLKVKVVAFISV